MSILPICDEFIVALGKGDDDDNSRQIIESIGSSKIRIIDTEWDIKKYPNGTELAHQTDIAKSYCTGDWLFYIQADEVVHEKYLPVIRSRCEELLNDSRIDGLLFKYTHFWADFNHFVDAHGWYKNEIRIIRNKPDIHSWRDAQSFRLIPNFDGNNYRQELNTAKLNVAAVDAYIYHYGWARPPKYMKTKNSEFVSLFTGKKVIEAGIFDYGPLNRYPIFKGTQPKIMEEWVSKFDWAGDLQYKGKINRKRELTKHEKLKYRFVTFLEKYLFRRPMWEFKNYTLVKK